MVVVGWFALATGVAVASLWIVLLARAQVPEIPAGRRDIWFHLVAEFLTAAGLVAAGVALLRWPGSSAENLAALALGALLYTTIASAGHYAEQRQWTAVGLFCLLAVTTLVAAGVLLAT